MRETLHYSSFITAGDPLLKPIVHYYPTVIPKTTYQEMVEKKVRKTGEIGETEDICHPLESILEMKWRTISSSCDLRNGPTILHLTYNPLTFLAYSTYLILFYSPYFILFSESCMQRNQYSHLRFKHTSYLILGQISELYCTSELKNLGKHYVLFLHLAT